jgi:hypothetical protein
LDGWLWRHVWEEEGSAPMKPPPFLLRSWLNLPARRLVASLMAGGETSLLCCAAPVHLFVSAAPPRRCHLLLVVLGHAVLMYRVGDG